MKIKKNHRAKPLQRTSSDMSRDSGVSGRFYRRFYAAIALFVVYSCCVYRSFERGLSRSLSEHSMVRKTSSSATQQLQHFDEPKFGVRIDPSPEKNASTVLVPQHSESGILEQVESPNQVDLAETNPLLAQTTKPRLFLHVGPQKTGSSTLQSMLDKLSDLTRSLPGDRLYYKHVMPEVGDFDCELDEWGGWHECAPSDKLKSFIDTAKEDGVNLLLTDENLDQNFVLGLREAISDDDWDVTVIVMYRRIHEWLVSWYNQKHKTTNRDSEGNILFDENGIPYRTEHTKWPDQGGSHVPTFRAFYEDFTQYWKPSELAEKHRSIEYYNIYKEYFQNVIFYNLHQEGSMVTDFVCNILEAANSCEQIKSHEIEIEKINGSVNLDLDILSVNAYEKGLISKSLPRKNVLEAVTNYIRETGKAIPRNCHAETTDGIRDWLLDTEKIMMGEDNWPNTKKRELLDLYAAFVDKGKSCDVDVDAVLADEDWIAFFQSLGAYKKGNFVLNVGPIGGNVIHDSLSTLAKSHQALQKDNYTMIEIDRTMNYFDCTSETCEASEKFRSILSSWEGTGTNIIISNDSLDERFVDAFHQVIDQEKWNVKVVVGHIRLDQSLLAMYENEYKEEHLESRSKELYSKWSSAGGIPIPDFNEWFGAFAEEYDATAIEEILGIHLRNSYLSSFENVEYSAYHPQTNVMLSNFVCQILPGATNTCNIAKAENSTDSLLDNFAEADILAVGAHESGLVGAEVTREALRDAIHKELLDSQKVLSRICVSSVTKQLYDWMVDNEKSMMGERFSSKHIAIINEDFQNLMQTGKLCAVDVEKELSDEAWINFFQDYHTSNEVVAQ